MTVSSGGYDPAAVNVRAVVCLNSVLKVVGLFTSWLHVLINVNVL
uniref:Uncharacterized protein n=1 Tax=Rhizophora mucronata TaxID=61149 RepID=A0A2P2N0X3_RHIMU